MGVGIEIIQDQCVDNSSFKKNQKVVANKGITEWYTSNPSQLTLSDLTIISRWEGKNGIDQVDAILAIPVELTINGKKYIHAKGTSVKLMVSDTKWQAHIFNCFPGQKRGWLWGGRKTKKARRNRRRSTHRRSTRKN
jgi:hypothetical protein